MRYAVCGLVFFLLLAGFFRLGTCKVISGEWEFYDEVPFKPKKVCVDHLDRKWFIASDGIRMLDDSGWTKYTQSSTGLPTGSVNTMAIGNDGSIWFGTYYNGAFRYDGTSWRGFSTDNSGIGNNRVNGFAFDREGGVWIVTPGDAVFFKNGRWSSSSADSFGGLTCAAVDEDGCVWFGTDSQCTLRFDGTGWRIFTHESIGIPARLVNTIRVAPDGRIAFGCNYYAYILDGSSWKVIPVSSAESIGIDEDGNIWFANEFSFWCCDGENLAEFPAYTTPIGKGNTESQSKIYDMATDREGNLWFATGKGVYRFSGRFVQIAQPARPSQSDVAVATAGSQFSISWISRGVDRVVLDYSLNGTVWNRIAGPLNANVRTVDWTIPKNLLPAGYLASLVILRITAVEDSSLTHVLNIRVEAPGLSEGLVKYTLINSGLASSNLRSLIEDTAGVKWFATDRGLSRFEGVTWQTVSTANSGLASDDVYDCARGSGGSLWFGTGSGISRLSGGMWETWLPGKAITRIAAGGTSAWALCPDSTDGDQQIPGDTVLYRFNGNSWIPQYEAEGDTLHSIVDIGIAPNGDLWLTRYQSESPRYHVLRFDGGRWHTFSPGESTYPINACPRHFAWDSSGKLWGTLEAGGSGLFSFDGTTWKTYTSRNSELKSGPINAYAFDFHGALWYSTSQGLYSFDGVRNTVTLDTVHGWLSSQMGSITGIYVDRDDVKWLLTGYGVVRFDKRLVPVEERKEQPSDFGITGNFPNPFNPATTICFSLTAPGKADLAVYDILGRRVRVLSSGYRETGFHAVRWNGRDDRGATVSSGVYFARLQSGSLVSTVRMLMVK